MEEVEVAVVHCAGELPTTKIEQAVLEARAGALAEELRVVRDYVAKLVGRVEQAGREGAVREDDAPGPCSSAGLCGDETAVSQGVAPGNGDAVAGQCEDEPVMSRRDLIHMMKSWPGTQVWAALHGAGGERGGGTRSDGGPVEKLRASGFGPVPGTEDGAE